MEGEYTCLTTDHPIPAGQDSYYYEVTVQPYVGCEDAPYVFFFHVRD